MKTFSIKQMRSVFAIMIVGGLLAVAYLVNPGLFKALNARAGISQNISGWTWSETVGWMSFNSFGCDSDKNGFVDAGICGGDNSTTVAQDYGVSVDTATKGTGGTGAITGNAWSENVGWVSFDRTRTGNPPSAPYNGGSGAVAQVDWSTGKVTGWMRALSACQNNLVNGSGNCTGSGAGDAAGGWDGWIKLSDEANPSWAGNGVKITTNKFSGYAWGGNVTSPAPTVSVSANVGSGPYDIIFDAAGNYYTANYWDKNISKVTPAGSVSIFATLAYGPTDLAFDSMGNLYATGLNSDTVSKITPSGTVSTFATVDPYPYRLVFDTAGNLYTANDSSSSISKITPGGTVSQFAKLSLTGGQGPVDLVFDTAGNLYTANNSNNTISKITPSGSSSVFATLGGRPYSITVDGTNNLYAVASDSNIYKITPSGSVAVFANLSSPGQDLDFDISGNLYTATYSGSNGTISKVTPSGSVSVFATVGSGARALAFSSGNLYSANSVANTVSKIVPGAISDSGVVGWVDFAPKIGGVSVGPVIGVPPCVASEVPASSWGACQPLVACPTTDQSGIQVGACSTGGTVTRSCTTAVRTCTPVTSGPVTATCNGNNICDNGETPLTCPSECKVKYKQF